VFLAKFSEDGAIAEGTCEAIAGVSSTSIDGLIAVSACSMKLLLL
jgi:hypothetical protein